MIFGLLQSIKIFNPRVIKLSLVKKCEGDKNLTVNHNPKHVINKKTSHDEIIKIAFRLLTSLNPVIIPAKCHS